MIRSYTTKDKPALIALLNFHIPEFFAESEESDFIKYLDTEVESYFVVEEEEQIIGAGGINYLYEQKEARISWDMIHPDFQGKGIGKQLTLHRINEIKKNPAIDSIIVRTSQVAYLFYQKVGFELEYTEQDFWAKGFDLYYMKMTI